MRIVVVSHLQIGSLNVRFLLENARWNATLTEGIDLVRLMDARPLVLCFGHGYCSMALAGGFVRGAR